MPQIENRMATSDVDFESRSTPNDPEVVLRECVEYAGGITQRNFTTVANSKMRSIKGGGDQTEATKTAMAEAKVAN